MAPVSINSPRLPSTVRSASATPLRASDTPKHVALTRSQQDSFERSVKTTDGVTPAQRKQTLAQAARALNELATRIVDAQPPLSSAEVKAEVARWTSVLNDPQKPGFIKAGFSGDDSTSLVQLGNAVKSLGDARQYIANGDFDRARAELNLPVSPEYAAMPEFQAWKAKHYGARDGIEKSAAAGALPGQYGGVSKALGDLSVMAEGKQTLEQQARTTLEAFDGIAKWNDSKGGWISSGGWDETIIAKARDIGADLRRILAIPEGAQVTPAKEVQLQQALQRAKSEVYNSLPEGNLAETLNKRREERFSAAEDFANKVSTLNGVPGPVGVGARVLSLGVKEIAVGLRYASGDMSATEAVVRTAVNALETFGASKIPGTGSLLSQALRAGGVKMSTTLTQDLTAIFANASKNNIPLSELSGPISGAVGKALAEGFKEAITQSLVGVKDLTLSTEAKRQLYEVLLQGAIKFNVDPSVREALDALLVDVPKHNPAAK